MVSLIYAILSVDRSIIAIAIGFGGGNENM